MPAIVSPSEIQLTKDKCISIVVMYNVAVNLTFVVSHIGNKPIACSCMLLLCSVVQIALGIASKSCVALAVCSGLVLLMENYSVL